MDVLPLKPQSNYSRSLGTELARRRRIRVSMRACCGTAGTNGLACGSCLAAGSQPAPDLLACQEAPVEEGCVDTPALAMLAMLQRPVNDCWLEASQLSCKSSDTRQARNMPLGYVHAGRRWSGSSVGSLTASSSTRTPSSMRT